MLQMNAESASFQPAEVLYLELLSETMKNDLEPLNVPKDLKI